MNNQTTAQFFLRYGYFPNFSPKVKINTSNVNRSRYSEYDEDKLIKIGIDKFRKAIEKEFQNNKSYLIPLSGGLDSRTILAFLREFTECKNIYTYTYGTPGTYDYDIGNRVAKEAKTNHRSFPLTEHKYSLEEELEVSRQVDYQTYLFHHPPIFEVLNNYKDMIVLSGYEVWKSVGYDIRLLRHPNLLINLLKYSRGKIAWSRNIGDWITKRNVNDNEVINIVKEMYASKSSGIMGKRFIFPNEDIFKELFTFEATTTHKNISFEEQIELQNYLVKCSAPHLLYKSLDIRTPHIDQEWLDFMMSLPENLRFHHCLFQKMVFKYDPDLFSIPTKGNYGLPLNSNSKKVKLNKFNYRLKSYANRMYKQSSSKMINYIDFNSGIRNRKDLNSLIRQSINDLIKRNLVEWIDIEKIWEKHISGFYNYALELILLASLEIHLKAGKTL